MNYCIELSCTISIKKKKKCGYIMKKFNKYQIWGLLLIAFGLTGKEMSVIPDFVIGFCLGYGIILTIIGLYAVSHNLTKIKNFKKGVIGRIINKQ